jgi:ERCC4-related helicase
MCFVRWHETYSHVFCLYLFDQAVQSVIQSLKISHIEMFTDESPDIKKFSFDKIIDKIVVGPNQMMQNLRRCLLTVLKQPVETLAKLGVIYQKNPEHVTVGSMIMTMKRIGKDKPANLNVRMFAMATRRTH